MPKVYSYRLILLLLLLCSWTGVFAAPAMSSEGDASLLKDLARNDSSNFACGSLPSGAALVEDKVLFQALPSEDGSSRIFQTDGTLIGTTERLPLLEGDHELLGPAARSNPIQYLYTASEDEIFTFNQVSPKLIYLFTPPFMANFLGSFGDSELFGQLDPPSFWWSQGTELRYSNVGQDNGRFSLVDRTDSAALIATKLIGIPNWRLSMLHPETGNEFVGFAETWTSAHPQPESTRRNLVLYTDNAGWSFVEVHEQPDGEFTVESAQTDCRFLSGLVPVGDGQVLFGGTCPDREEPGVFLVENSTVTFIRDTAVLPPTPIGTPIPSPPGLRGSKPGDRVIVEVYTEEGYAPFVWNEETRDLDPVEPLDHELLELVYEEPSLRLYRGELNGTQALWALDSEGTLAPILEYETTTPGSLHPTRIEDRILFYFDDGVHGRELWMTDGTMAKTQLVEDIEPGEDGLQSAYCVNKGFRFDDTDLPVLRPTVIGDRVLFSGFRNGLGIEPFTVPLDTFIDEEEPPTNEPEACKDPQTLCLRSGDFQIRTTWSTSTESGVGTPVEAGTEDTGLFWFFQPTNWELMVKVLDGCEINGHLWVLAGGTTDVGYRLEIERTEDSLVWSRDNPLGQRSPSIIDVEAFPCIP